MLFDPRIALANVLRRRTPSQREGLDNAYLSELYILPIADMTLNSSFPRVGLLNITPPPVNYFLP